MTILLTGAAGFIGMHVAETLLARGEKVIGIDSLTPYYDLRLKHARRDRLLAQPNFSFFEVSIADRTAISEIFSQNKEITQTQKLKTENNNLHFKQNSVENLME